MKKKLQLLSAETLDLLEKNSRHNTLLVIYCLRFQECLVFDQREGVKMQKVFLEKIRYMIGVCTSFQPWIIRKDPNKFENETFGYFFKTESDPIRL